MCEQVSLFFAFCLFGCFFSVSFLGCFFFYLFVLANLNKLVFLLSHFILLISNRNLLISKSET